MSSSYKVCAWCAREFYTGGWSRQRGYVEYRWFCSRKCCSEAPEGIGEKRAIGCFITTAVCSELQLPDDCRELTTLRRFRDAHMLATPSGRALVERYYKIAPGMVAAIDAHEARAEIYRELRTRYIEPAVTAAEAGDNLGAERFYTTMMGWLEERLAGAPSRS